MPRPGPIAMISQQQPQCARARMVILACIGLECLHAVEGAASSLAPSSGTQVPLGGPRAPLEGISCVIDGVISFEENCTCNAETNYTCRNRVEAKRGYTVQEDYKKCMTTVTGIVLPGIYTWPKWLQATMYLSALFYCFLGVAVVADLFMEAIEKITSKKKEIETVDVHSQQPIKVTVHFWNPTVANLTLLALGSSAPEILLAVIETVTSLGEEPGELGASTIVGSAAFNLLAITAVCTISVPDGEQRRVTQVRVFICTSLWSLFAYFWVVIVLDVWTPDQVTLVEAIITFLCMPAMVLSAFYIDKWESNSSKDSAATSGKPSQNWVGGGEFGDRINGATIQGEGGVQLADRKKITDMLRSMDNDQEAVAAMLLREMPPEPVSRAQARCNAVKSLTGQKHYSSQSQNDDRRIRRGSVKVHPQPQFDEKQTNQNARQVLLDDTVNGLAKSAADLEKNVGILFDTTTMICRESQGDVELNVKLTRKSKKTITVDYRTVEGTAEANSDFVPCNGTLTFAPGVISQKIAVTLIDDEEFEPDETFTVHLSNPQGGMLISPTQVLVVVVDDHEPGQLGFEKRFYNVKETDEFAIVPVCRTYGAAGRVSVNYSTSDGVATEGKDYVATSGTLVFEDGEVTKDIHVPIILDEEPDNNENFCISLSKPQGGASMNKLNMAVVTILDDSDIDAVAHTVAVLLRQRVSTMQSTPRPYRQQFIDALSLEGSVDDMGAVVSPSNFQAILHFSSIFWKVLFATVPPTDYCNGWATFWVSLMYIGGVTAIVGDLANQFGCVLNMKPVVTAIIFVALGTSLPDLFASKAAITEGTDADAAVGNVTGSNSVNVFLGLGLPWLIAVVYYRSKNQKYCVPAGSLAFSVVVFSICAVIALGILALRRKTVGAELGGTRKGKRTVACVMILLWVIYLTLSSLQAYGSLGIEARESVCVSP